MIRVYNLKFMLREKGRDLAQSNYKSLYTNRKKQTGNMTIHKKNSKNSITRPLRTDSRRSFGVTTVTQLLWLTGLWAQPSNSPQLL